MANEIQKGSVPAIPSAGAPITQVNQYGDRSVHADHVENLNVTVIENQGSPTEDENGVPFVPLTPTRWYDTVSFIERGTGKVCVMEPSVFFRHYRNTGESVSSYLEVVLGNLPF